MSQTGGPWHKPPAGRTNRSGSRFLIWLALIAAGALAIWELNRLFPDSLSDTGDQAYLVKLCAILVLLASGIAYGRRVDVKETVRNVALWAGIAAVLVFAYVSFPQIQNTFNNVRSELTPGYPVSTNASEMVFSKDRDGDFLIVGDANGTKVKFLVDTGASDIVLSPSDAQRIGIDTSKLSFDRRYGTANGEGRGAPFTLDALRIGSVEFRDVQVAINGTAMPTSLLGMAFLDRMKSFEFRGRKLYLRWR